MAHITHKLANSIEGALAGGGDPATSPLYVFGPFLKLIVVAGVAEITFGASIWLVVFTVAAVSGSGPPVSPTGLKNRPQISQINQLV